MPVKISFLTAFTATVRFRVNQRFDPQSKFLSLKVLTLCAMLDVLD